MRFYDHDGIEMDVQDPKFFIDEDTLQAQQEAITEMLSLLRYDNIAYLNCPVKGSRGRVVKYS